MPIAEDKKLVFSRDQIVTSSQASKNFGEVRRRAAERPQFVSGRSGIDTVVVGFEQFEDMYLELERLREEKFYARVAARLSTPEERISLEEALGDDYERFLSIDPDAVSDAELFE
ncbi:hypothetical protein [Arabiibacter massiliensis]|uniref:hypothetical protein n=1 Tax=Arabiibacter massiliensis TaxID=1870985 RepID=UPI0009BC1BCE|nr:hypothetical protein [Arabiibacter massiliensis]